MKFQPTAANSHSSIHKTLFKSAIPTTLCRVKRHLISTSIHEHGSTAELKLKTAIPTHHPNTTEAKTNQGPKLYSKVLAIEPNRLLKTIELD